MSKARRTDLVVHLSHYVNSPEFMDVYGRIWRAEIKTAADAEKVCSSGEVVAMANFFETLGFLVRNKDVEAYAVRDLMGSMALGLWDKISPFTFERRKGFSPTVLHNFEWL